MSETAEDLVPLEIISPTPKKVAYRDAFPELQAEKKLIDEIKNKMKNEDYDESEESENESVSIEVNDENKVNDEKNKEFRDIEIQVDEVKQDDKNEKIDEIKVTKEENVQDIQDVQSGDDFIKKMSEKYDSQILNQKPILPSNYEQQNVNVEQQNVNIEQQNVNIDHDFIKKLSQQHILEEEKEEKPEIVNKNVKNETNKEIFNVESIRSSKFLLIGAAGLYLLNTLNALGEYFL